MKRKEAILHQLVHAAVGGQWLLSSTQQPLNEYKERMIKLAFNSLLDSGALAGFSTMDCAAVYQASLGQTWAAFIAERNETLSHELAQNAALLAQTEESAEVTA